MVELQIVVLAVAGSSPVGHPARAARGKHQIPNSKLQVYEIRRSLWNLGFAAWDFRGGPAVAYALLNDDPMINPAVVESVNANDAWSGFWQRLLNDEQLRDCDGLEKIVIGCELIAALDAVDLLAA